MKRSRLAAIAAALSFVAGATLATNALGQTPGRSTTTAASGTRCTLSNVATVFIPGLSTEPRQSSFYTKPGATISCDGPVDGATPTGPGVYNSAGRLGTEDPDSCGSPGEGWSVQQLEIPTDAGMKVIRNTFTFTYSALQGGALFGGEWRGDYTDGTFRATSLDEGDCISSPVTEATFDGTLTFHEFRAPEG
jgi:hypothetical protein